MMDILSPSWEDLAGPLSEKEILCRLMDKVDCAIAISKERSADADNLPHVIANIIKLLNECNQFANYDGPIQDRSRSKHAATDLGVVALAHLLHHPRVQSI